MADLPNSQSPGADLVAPAKKPEPLLRRLSPVPFALLSLAIIFVLYQVVGGLITVIIARGDINITNVNLIRWATLGGQILLILLPTLWLAHLRHGQLVRFFRIRLPAVGELLVTMVAVFALQQILQSYMLFQDAIPLPSDLQRAVDVFKRLLDEMTRVLVQAHSPWEFLFVVLVVAFIPAVSEELLFRGLVQRNVEQATGGIRAAVIAGVIFGAYHLNPFNIVPLVVLGIYFGFIVYRSENITLAMSAHFFNNFVACSAVYLQLDDNFVAVAPAGQPTLTIAAANFVLFMVVFVAATLYFVHMTSTEDVDRPY